MVSILVVAIGATVIWILQPPAKGQAPQNGEDTAAARESERTQPDPATVLATTPDRADAAPTQTAFVRAFGAKSGNLYHLVALDHQGRDPELMHFAIAAAALPTEEPVLAADGTHYSAVAWERRTGLVLLLGPRVTTEGFEPVSIRNAREIDPRDKSALAVRRADEFPGNEVRFDWFGERMRLSPGIADGALLVDAQGRGIALVHGNAGLPLQAITPWRDYWNGRPLEAIQREIRDNDPQLILTDARALLHSKTTTIERAERALAMLERGQHLAQDRAAIQAFDRMIRFAHRQRVRLLSETSGIAALQQARKSLRSIGNDPDLLRDTIELSIRHGAPADSLALYQQLLARSPDHARAVSSKLANRMTALADDMLRDSRNEDARRLLADTVRNLPQRADLRMLYAKALFRLGDDINARAEANAAARLDRSYAKLAKGFNSPNRKRRIEIPYDKRQSTIRVQGAVSGEPIEFLVDTGASYSTIPTAIAQRLGLLNGKNPIVNVTTASGKVRAQQVRIKLVTIAKRVRVREVTAVVMDLPGNLAGKGLLGLDVLSSLNMKIDHGRGRLILTPTRSGGRKR